jgi:hypothetical protein
MIEDTSVFMMILVVILMIPDVLLKNQMYFYKYRIKNIKKVDFLFENINFEEI